MRIWFGVEVMVLDWGEKLVRSDDCERVFSLRVKLYV